MAVVTRSAAGRGSGSSHASDEVSVCFDAFEPGSVLLAHIYRRVQHVMRGGGKPVALSQAEYEARRARKVCPGHSVEGGSVLTEEGRLAAVRS